MGYRYPLVDWGHLYRVLLVFHIRAVGLGLSYRTPMVDRDHL